MSLADGPKREVWRLSLPAAVEAGSSFLFCDVSDSTEAVCSEELRLGNCVSQCYAVSLFLTRWCGL